MPIDPPHLPPRRARPSRRRRWGKVGLATWEGLPDLTPEDRLLAGELSICGVTVVPLVWSDPRSERQGCDAVVLRSTWDYHRRREEFLAWTERIARRSHLFNPAHVVRWNSHKSYLKDLERAQVPIVPTWMGGDPAEALVAARSSRWKEVVLKPAVSADGFRTYRVDALEEDRFRASFQEVRAHSEVLMQPYMRQTEDAGERSLVFFAGEFSHAFLKPPLLASDHRKAVARLGTPVAASRQERSIARRALAASPGPQLYARVDLVQDTRGLPRVMEVELIEPALETQEASGAPGRFADALLRGGN